MKKIKGFLNKSKNDYAFKKCGPGYRLTESNSSGGSSAISEKPSEHSPSVERASGPDENITKATLARLEKKDSQKKSTLYNIFDEEKKKLTMEIKMKEENEEKRRNEVKDQEKENVNPFKEFEEAQRFTCTALGLIEPVPFKDIIPAIKSTIFDNYEDDPILRSAMLLFNCNRTLNQNITKLEMGIEVLLKIIKNLMTEDENLLEKYKRIRKSKIEDKVLSLIGAQDFLFAIGFTVDKDEPDWLSYEDDGTDIKTKMNYLIDILSNPQIIPIELDRQVHELDGQEQFKGGNEEYDNLNLTAKELKHYMDNLEKEREINEMFISKESKIKLIAGNQGNFHSIFTQLRFKMNILGELKIIEAMFYSKETLFDVKLWLKKEYSAIFGEKDLQLKNGLTLLQEDSETLQALKLSPASTLIVI